MIQANAVAGSAFVDVVHAPGGQFQPIRSERIERPPVGSFRFGIAHAWVYWLLGRRCSIILAIGSYQHPASTALHHAPNAMPSLTVENYAKAIYQLAHATDDGAVATGQIAAALGVLPGTVTSMLKTLDESNLATYTPYEGVRLTHSGRALALRVLRRHRLIEQFLSQTLNLSWDEVHEEAEHMEHAVSDSLVDRIDAYLGHPSTDPHGDPIPRADGTVAAIAVRPLADAPWATDFAWRAGGSVVRVPAILVAKRFGDWGAGVAGGERPVAGCCHDSARPKRSGTFPRCGRAS